MFCHQQKLINENEINLKYDKLKNLMDVNNYTFEKIIDVIKSFKNIRIHVVGDLIIDTHNECEAVAGLHKSPTLSLIKKKFKFLFRWSRNSCSSFCIFLKKSNTYYSD